MDQVNLIERRLLENRTAPITTRLTPLLIGSPSTTKMGHWEEDIFV